MFQTVIFTVLCGLAAAVPSLHMDHHWELWKKMHNKAYAHQVKAEVFNPAEVITLRGLYYLGTRMGDQYL